MLKDVRSSEFACLHEAFRRRQGVRSFKAKHYELRTNYSELIDSRSGVTLIELIFAILIIGVLAVTVLPKIDFGSISSRASVDGAAYMIASDIRYAQECATATRASKTVTFSAGGNTYSFSPANDLDPTGQLPSGVTTTAFTLTFNSLGEPTTGGGGTVTVSAGGQWRTIMVVNYAGKVNIS